MTAGVTTFGFQCKLLVYATANWDGTEYEAGNISDATLELGMAEVDASIRESGGFEITETALAQVAINATLEWRNDNTLCELLHAFFIQRGVVYLRALTGPKTDPDARGVRGAFKITKFPTAQDLNDLAKVAIQFKPARSSLLEFYVTGDEGAEPVSFTMDSDDQAEEIEQEKEPAIDG